MQLIWGKLIWGAVPLRLYSISKIKKTLGRNDLPNTHSFIKRVIDCLTRDHFENATNLNALWDYQLVVIGQTVQKLECKQTNKRTDGRTDVTKHIISLASRLINMEFPADVVWSGFSIFIKLAHCQWGFKPDSHWGKLLILGNHTDIKGIWCDIAMTSPMTQKSYTITLLLLWQHVSIATVVWVFSPSFRTLAPILGSISPKTPPKNQFFQVTMATHWFLWK